MKNVSSSKCLNLGIQQNTREYNFNVIKLPTYKKNTNTDSIPQLTNAH